MLADPMGISGQGSHKLTSPDTFPAMGLHGPGESLLQVGLLESPLPMTFPQRTTHVWSNRKDIISKYRIVVKVNKLSFMKN